MQPINKMTTVLQAIADGEHYLFTLSDLHAPCRIKAQVDSRHCSVGRKGWFIKGVCSGVYLFRDITEIQNIST